MRILKYLSAPRTTIIIFLLIIATLIIALHKGGTHVEYTIWEYLNNNHLTVAIITSILIIPAHMTTSIIEQLVNNTEKLYKEGILKSKISPHLVEDYYNSVIIIELLLTLTLLLSLIYPLIKSTYTAILILSTLLTAITELSLETTSLLKSLILTHIL